MNLVYIRQLDMLVKYTSGDANQASWIYKSENQTKDTGQTYKFKNHQKMNSKLGHGMEKTGGRKMV